MSDGFWSSLVDSNIHAYISPSLKLTEMHSGDIELHNVKIANKTKIETACR